MKKPSRPTVIASASAAALLAVGGAVFLGTSAGADTASRAAAVVTSAAGGQDAGHRDGERRGPKTELTGETAAKVKAAALAAHPGATVTSTHAESEGTGIYEAHVTKADGTQIEVTFDKDFAVVSTESGKKRGDRGHHRGSKGTTSDGQSPSTSPNPTPSSSASAPGPVS